jgi:hypothetical protein
MLHKLYEQTKHVREDVISVHNSQLWARNNPHASLERGYQVSFSVRVNAGTVGEAPAYYLTGLLDNIVIFLPGLLEYPCLAAGQSSCSPVDENDISRNQVEVQGFSVFPLEDGHTTEPCSGN